MLNNAIITSFTSCIFANHSKVMREHILLLNTGGKTTFISLPVRWLHIVPSTRADNIARASLRACACTDLVDFLFW